MKTGSLHNLYGPTEAAIDVSYWDCSAADDIVPIGSPIQNIQLHVLDEDFKVITNRCRGGTLYIGRGP